MYRVPGLLPIESTREIPGQSPSGLDWGLAHLRNHTRGRLLGLKI